MHHGAISGAAGSPINPTAQIDTSGTRANLRPSSEQSEPHGQRAKRASREQPSAAVRRCAKQRNHRSRNRRSTGRTNPRSQRVPSVRATQAEPAAAMKVTSSRSRDSAPRRSCLATSDRWKRPTGKLERFVPTGRLPSSNSAVHQPLGTTKAGTPKPLIRQGHRFR